jgi:hypothetical protein
MPVTRGAWIAGLRPRLMGGRRGAGRGAALLPGAIHGGRRYREALHVADLPDQLLDDLGLPRRDLRPWPRYWV